MKNFIFLISCVLLVGCESRSPEHSSAAYDSTLQAVKDTSDMHEHYPIISNNISSSDSFYVDASLKEYMERIGMGQVYIVSTRHQPYCLTGYFNDDDIIDTAIIVYHTQNHKDGLLIKHGESDEYIIIGAGQEVLGQGFDDMDWIGIFHKIDKGEKIASNIDEESGEILTEDIPDSKKFTLYTEGIYVHQAEACGGGIIYWDKNTYHWIQQE